MKLYLGLLMLMFVSHKSLASLSSISLDLNTSLEVSLWQRGEGNPPEKDSVAAALYNLKKSELQGDLANCTIWANRSLRKAKDLAPWIILSQMNCALKANSKLKLSVLARNLQALESNKDYLLHGPHRDELRRVAVEASLILFEKQIKSDRSKAWKSFAELEERIAWMSQNQRADLYRMGGELAFIQQNLVVAQDFLSRSLELRGSESLQQKLEAVRNSLAKLESKSATIKAEKKQVQAESLEASEEENQLYHRMQASLGAGRLVEAVEDGIEIIKTYPGGRRARWASDRILDTYLSVLGRKSDKYRLIHERVFQLIGEADGVRLAAWAEGVGSRGYYKEALALAELSVSRLGTQPLTTDVLNLAGQMATWSGEYEKALKIFDTIIGKHAGSEAFQYALFRAGLVHLRLQQFSEASALFEKLMAIGPIDNLDYLTRYWQWRTQQKLNETRAKEFAADLIKRYPLTYYGLRARAEVEGGELRLPAASESLPKPEIWLTTRESLAWQRFIVLLKAGWLEEARQELKVLPNRGSLDGKLAKAYLAAEAKDNYSATKVLTELWDQDASWIRPKLIEMIYPRSFGQKVKEHSAAFSLDENLVFALIRQESSFRSKVTSPAGATGLMQLVPITASETARFLKMKGSPDILDPDTNIRMGSHYLSRMVRAFNGHIPLALAAYNAGIGNIRRWTGARPELKSLDSKLSSDPFDEIWIDELPWDETRYYVKAILRNWMIYSLREAQKLTLKNPIWIKD